MSYRRHNCRRRSVTAPVMYNILRKKQGQHHPLELFSKSAIVCEPTTRVSFSGRTPAFQAGSGGSIPPTRTYSQKICESRFFVAICSGWGGIDRGSRYTSFVMMWSFSGTQYKDLSARRGRQRLVELER